jgi:hypothetical protein
MILKNLLTVYYVIGSVEIWPSNSKVFVDKCKNIMGYYNEVLYRRGLRNFERSVSDLHS